MNGKEKPFKVGLALSGGGAKGFAHAGAIKALNDFGIYPDVIAGTSAGSIVGVLYADGNTPEDILDFFDKTSFSQFATFARSRSGLFKIEQFRKALRRRLTALTFEELRIPLFVNATDMINGRNVFFNTGPLLDVIIASCSVPIVFEPVRMDGIYYSDGGLICNFPVEILRDKCDYVIGVNVGPIELDNKEDLKLMEIAQRTYFFMRKANVLSVKEKCDLLIEPQKIDHYGMFDTKHNHEIFQDGYDSTIAVLNSGVHIPLKL